MEYLVVKVPGTRRVNVDGFVSGITNTVLGLEAGTHTVALEPSTGSRPLRQTIVLVSTTPLNPVVVTFDLDQDSS